MKTLILLFALITCLGCRKYYFDSDNAIIKNESENNIVILKQYFDYQSNSNDTIIYDDLSIYEISMKSIQPQETLVIINWNKRKENAISASDTFSIHIFDEKTIYEYSWKIICNKYMVLCRYDLSGQDIIKLNYIIPYPPSSAMKDMKMYPSYEEIINKEQK